MLGDPNISGAGVNGGYTECVRVYKTSEQTLANNIITTLTFDSERWDTDDIHDTVSNTSRLTCKTAGKYSIIGQARFHDNQTGRRNLFIWLNATTYIAGKQIDRSPAGATEMEITTQYDLAVGDYVELRARQNAGGNLNIENVANRNTEFMMARIG